MTKPLHPPPPPEYIRMGDTINEDSESLRSMDHKSMKKSYQCATNNVTIFALYYVWVWQPFGRIFMMIKPDKSVLYNEIGIVLDDELYGD